MLPAQRGLDRLYTISSHCFLVSLSTVAMLSFIAIITNSYLFFLVQRAWRKSVGAALHTSAPCQRWNSSVNEIFCLGPFFPLPARVSVCVSHARSCLQHFCMCITAFGLSVSLLLTRSHIHIISRQLWCVYGEGKNKTLSHCKFVIILNISSSGY